MFGCRFSGGDYLRDTGHLETVEHGAYMLLMGHYWSTGEPLPDDNKRLANITGLGLDVWLTIRPTISEFFEVKNGKWTHKRIEHELKKAIRNRRVASEKGHKGAHARWHSDDASENDIDDEIYALFDNGDEDPSSIS